MKISLFVLAVLACVAGYLVGLHEGRLPGISLGWLGVILALTLIHFLVEPLRWQIYLGKGAGGRWITFYHVFSCTAFLSYILPAKLGLPLRYWLITHYQGLTAGVVGTYMVIDSALGLILWAIFSLLLGGNLVFWLVSEYSFTVKVVTLGLILTALLSVLAIWLSRHNRRRWLAQLEASLSLVRLNQVIQASFLFTLDIVGYILRHAAILAALSVPFIGWKAIATASVLSIFSGFLCMLPMGLIGYDVVIVFLLARYGVATETALMVPLINRFSNLLLSAAVGVPSSLKLGLGMNTRSVSAIISGKRNV